MIVKRTQASVKLELGSHKWIFQALKFFKIRMISCYFITCVSINIWEWQVHQRHFVDRAMEQSNIICLGFNCKE